MPTAIAIAAHPDDIEFLMAGTLIRLKAAGYEIHYFNIANGCCGSTQTGAEETAAIRAQEGRNAAALLGAVFHESICNDLEIFYDRATLGKVAAVIRQAQPEIVLTHSPVDYMEDHTNACRLAVTATFARGMPNFVTDPNEPAQPGDVAVYHAQPYSNHGPLKQPITPEFCVDTTDILEAKVAALAEHKSQQQWLDESQKLNSYLQTLRDLDAEVGKMSRRFDFAEGWRRHLHLGFSSADFDPLGKALAEHIVAMH